jgi:hypothetical protein
MTDPIDISISLGGFMDFVTATASQRITVVRSIADMYAADYQPGRDFYKDFRDALKEGMLRGDDIQRVHDTVDHATDRKRSNYQAVAVGWEQWRRRKNLVLFGISERWQEQQLGVRVSPAFVWRQRSGPRLVVPYYKGPALSADAAQAGTRVIERAFGDGYGRAAVLDVRRARLHVGRENRSRDYDAWLAGEVSALLRMFHSIRRAA